MKVMHRIMQYVEPRWNNLGKNSMTLRNCMVWPVFKKWHVCWGQRGKSAKRRGWETLTGGACQEKKKKTLPLPSFLRWSQDCLHNFTQPKILKTASKHTWPASIFHCFAIFKINHLSNIHRCKFVLAKFCTMSRRKLGSRPQQLRAIQGKSRHNQRLCSCILSCILSTHWIRHHPL